MTASQPRLFIVAGMPRTATTFLYQRFQDHPLIFCPYRKETNFFSVNFGKSLEWYRQLYAGMAADQIGADVSPVYFLDVNAIDRIRGYDPRTPVILGVRPASEWALSWYTQVLSNHFGEKPSFEEFATGYALRISGGEIWQDFRNGFVRRMIVRYKAAFGSTLFLYHYRALHDDAVGLINSIEDFLGLPRFFSEKNFRNEIVNAGARRNIGLIADLLSREGFVDAVGKLVPRRLVQAARNAYVAFGTSKGEAKQPPLSDDDKALAREIFAEDDAWIESLFAESAIQPASSGLQQMVAESQGQLENRERGIDMTGGRKDG